MQKVGAAAGIPALGGGGHMGRGPGSAGQGSQLPAKKRPDFYRVTTPTRLISNHWQLDHVSLQIPGY